MEKYNVKTLFIIIKKKLKIVPLQNYEHQNPANRPSRGSTQMGSDVVKQLVKVLPMKNQLNPAKGKVGSDSSHGTPPAKVKVATGSGDNPVPPMKREASNVGTKKMPSAPAPSPKLPGHSQGAPSRPPPAGPPSESLHTVQMFNGEYKFTSPDCEENIKLVDENGKKEIKCATLEKLVEKVTHEGHPGKKE